jgi:hypothetical protein
VSVGGLAGVALTIHLSSSLSAFPLRRPASAVSLSSTPSSTTATDPLTVYLGGQWKTRVHTIAHNLATLTTVQPTDFHSIETICRALSRDVRTAQDYGPIPDPQAQSHWAFALKLWGQAGTQCVTAAHTRTSSLFTQSTAELTDGATEVSKMTTRLHELGH